MDPNQQSSIQQNPMPQQQVSQIHSSKSKWKLIIFIIFLLLIVGIGAYYLGAKQNKLIVQNQQESIAPTITQSIPSPSPDPTVNWKIYVNTKIGFQIKYPPRYPKPGLPSGAPGSPTLYADENTDNNDLIFGLTSSDSIGLIVFPYTGTLDELNNYKNLPISLPSYKMSLIKNIQVDGVEAQWYGASPEVGATNIYFIGVNHGFILHSQSVHNQEELNQMLSTFKFLADCTAVADFICPAWCSAGSDVDCCTEKPGYSWIQGRGCYKK